MTNCARVSVSMEKQEDDGHIIRAKTMDEAMQKLSARARRQVNRAFQESPYFHQSFQALDALPKFSYQELGLGKLLGKGQFGTVYEIISFNLDSNFDTGEQENEQVVLPQSLEDSNKMKDKKESPPLESEVRFSFASKPLPDQALVFVGGEVSNTSVRDTSSREFLRNHCLREDRSGHARYAMKRLQERHYKNPTRFYQGAKDLALEAHFLASIEHPNIVKMRGMAIDSERCGKNNFLILDRLYSTLETQKSVWKAREEEFSGIKGFFKDPKREKRNELLEERMMVLFDLSSALSYLHEVHILHRDLKPDNIGFDVRGDVKIFDFGLAKELPSKQSRPYRLTGNTGSMRYMAPEVFACERYDERADVYSFGLLIWEVVALEKAFDGFGVSQFKEEVFNYGVRPNIQRNWNSQICELMQKCYHRDYNCRPFMKDVRDTLKNNLVNTLMLDVSDLDKESTRRRSTYVYRQGVEKSGK